MEGRKINFEETIYLAQAIVNEVGFDYNRFVSLVERIGLNLMFDVENFVLLYLIPHYKEHKDIHDDVLNISPYKELLTNYSKEMLIEKIKHMIEKLYKDYSSDEYALMFLVAILQRFMLDSVKDTNLESLDSLFSGIVIYSVFNNIEFESFVDRTKMPETIRKFARNLFERVSHHLETHHDESMRIQILISFINAFMMPYIMYLNKMKRDIKDTHTVIPKDASFIYIDPKNKSIN